MGMGGQDIGEPEPEPEQENPFGKDDAVDDNEDKQAPPFGKKKEKRTDSEDKE